MTRHKTKTQTQTENLTGVKMSRTVGAAARGDWKTQAMPDATVTREVERRYSAAEAEAIRFGSLPWQMEDKWFIFYEDGKLFFHRSWTGLCVFVMHFREDGDALVAHRLDINGETADADSESLAFHLIEALLLERDGDMPGAEPDNPSREWSVMGQASGFVRRREKYKKHSAK